MTNQELIAEVRVALAKATPQVTRNFLDEMDRQRAISDHLDGMAPTWLADLADRLERAEARVLQLEQEKSGGMNDPMQHLEGGW